MLYNNYGDIIMKEKWEKIEGFDNYLISNYGNVKSIKNNIILKKSINKYGYIVYCLRKKNKGFVLYAHRLVAKTFISNPNNLPQVNHKDENKLNNRVDNLEWCTNIYNSNYGTRGKRIAKKLSIALKKPIKQIKNNKVIKIWDSAKDVEEKTNIKRSNICKCLKGFRKSAGGFNWEYENNY